MIHKKRQRSERRLHRPIFRFHRVDARHPMPGPGRRYDRLHFARMAHSEAVILFTMAILIGGWLLSELGIVPRPSQWFW